MTAAKERPGNRGDKSDTNGGTTKISVDSGLPSSIFPIMATRRTKIPDLNEVDLYNMDVADIDSLLSVVHTFTAAALGVRNYKAGIANITTAPPALPPMVGGRPSDQERTPTGAVPVRINSSRRSPNSLPEPPEHCTWVNGSTVHTAFKIIERYPRGVDLPIFREEFEKANSSGDGASLHSKTLWKLRHTRHVVSYKKKLFAYDRLKQFLDDVKAGAVDDIPDDQPTLHGKWAVAVYEYVRSHNGDWVDYRDIVEHVMRQPGFENTANAASQVAVALRGLQYRHKLIEKLKRGHKSQYRLLTSEQVEPSPAEGESVFA